MKIHIILYAAYLLKYRGNKVNYVYKPTVAQNVDLKSALQNLCKMLVFPTPESPTKTTLNTRVGASD